MRLPRLFHRAPDVAIGKPGDPYMLRWHLIPRNRFLNIYLHKFLRDDEDRALHDHPWASLSLILKGGYIEHVFQQPGMSFRTRTIIRKRWRLIYRAAEHAHRIELFKFTFYEADSRDNRMIQVICRRPAWTIFITGPKVREWGFHCPNVGWRHWRKFIGLPEGQPRGDEIGAGCGE